MRKRIREDNKNVFILKKGIEKLQEYNEIDDMNNSLFDQKLTRIEEYCKG